MKNLTQLVIAAILLLNSLAVVATKIDIHNKSGMPLYIALVATEKGSKNRKIRKKGIYARYLSTRPNTISPLGQNEYIEIENLPLSLSYDRSLWVYNAPDSLRQAIQKGSQDEGTGRVFEAGSAKAIVITASEADQFKFEKYTLSKPKNNKAANRSTTTIREFKEGGTTVK